MAVEILQNVYNKLQTKISKIMSSSKQSLEDCRFNLAKNQEDLKKCNFENGNISSLVFLHYQNINSSLISDGNWQRNLGSNATTTEILNAIEGEYKWMEGRFYFSKNEMKKTNDFIRTDLIALLPSVDWISYGIRNENHLTFEILQKFYSELKNKMTDRDKLKSELSVKNTFIENLLKNDFRCFEEKMDFNKNVFNV